MNERLQHGTQDAPSHLRTRALYALRGRRVRGAPLFLPLPLPTRLIHRAGSFGFGDGGRNLVRQRQEGAAGTGTRGF